MPDVNYEGLLEMWTKKLEKNRQFLELAELPADEDNELVLNLYLPKHCGAKHQGNNMITNEELDEEVQKKPEAKAFLLYSCVNITTPGIASALSVLNTLTVLVLDELKLSHKMLMTIAEKVKTLRVLSLFAFIGDVTDESIEAVAKENPQLQWMILPGFAHQPMKITSKSVHHVVKYCRGLKRISMPTIIFNDDAVSSMIEHLHPEEFELLDVRKMGKKNDMNPDMLRQLFEKFPKLRVEEGSLLDVQPHILRKADVSLGFEKIEIGQRKDGFAVPPEEFLKILDGKHAKMVKKLSITQKKDEMLKALINKNLHNQITEMDFGICMPNAMPKSTQKLIAQFTGLENLNLAFQLGEADYDGDYVKSNDIVKMLSKMNNLKKLDLSWSAISPEGVKKIVTSHPTLVDLNMEGCGGESYNYTDFLMGCDDLKCLRRPGLKWSSRNKYGERSGKYQNEARRELEALGMDTGRSVPDNGGEMFDCYDSDDLDDSMDCSDSDEE